MRCLHPTSSAFDSPSGTKERSPCAADALAEFVRGEGRSTFRVLGPAIAPLARIRGHYRFQVLLMGRERPAMNERLRALLELWGQRGPKARKALRRLEVDVDPLALL